MDDITTKTRFYINSLLNDGFGLDGMGIDRNLAVGIIKGTIKARRKDLLTVEQIYIASEKWKADHRIKAFFKKLALKSFFLIFVIWYGGQWCIKRIKRGQHNGGSNVRSSN